MVKSSYFAFKERQVDVYLLHWFGVLSVGRSHDNITKTRLFKYLEKISPPKTDNFQIKKTLNFFHISAQNIDCGYSLEPPRRGGSNEYPQYMFLSRNKKKMYTPVKPSFTI